MRISSGKPWSPEDYDLDKDGRNWLDGQPVSVADCFEMLTAGQVLHWKAVKDLGLQARVDVSIAPVSIDLVCAFPMRGLVDTINTGLGDIGRINDRHVMIGRIMLVLLFMVKDGDTVFSIAEPIIKND